MARRQIRMVNGRPIADSRGHEARRAESFPDLRREKERAEMSNDPVIIVLDGRPVGLVMPMVMPH